MKHVIAAIGSSSQEKALGFVKDNMKGVAPETVHTYGSYAPVYIDDSVDIVYVGTPHVFHKQNCLEAINAGKHVLCEKPVTINERDAREVIEAANSKGVFFMEGINQSYSVF